MRNFLNCEYYCLLAELCLNFLCSLRRSTNIMQWACQDNMQKNKPLEINDVRKTM